MKKESESVAKEISLSINFKKPKKLHGKIVAGFFLEMVHQTVTYAGPEITYGTAFYRASCVKNDLTEIKIQKLTEKLIQMGMYATVHRHSHPNIWVENARE